MASCRGPTIPNGLTGAVWSLGKKNIKRRRRRRMSVRKAQRVLKELRDKDGCHGLAYKGGTTLYQLRGSV